MMFSINDCRPLGVDPTLHPVQLFCEDNEYNAVAALWFQTPEASVKALFHDPPASHQLLTLCVFVLVYYPLSCITYGLSVSMGIFIPVLVSIDKRNSLLNYVQCYPFIMNLFAS